MELPISQEAEMPIPLNSSYGGSHGHHHHDHPHPPPQFLPAGPHIPPAGPTLDDDDDDEEDNEDHYHMVVPFKKAPPPPPATARYRECLKNHAAAMGGNATDGCGEFMPGGVGGALDALTCSACGCHRNFHRKETEGDPSHYPRIGRRTYLSHHHNHHQRGIYIMGQEGPSRPHHIGPNHHHHQLILPNVDEGMDRGMREGAKKRFRTKFTQEQKEKMLGFAERVGWKIQKQEEAVVQRFCQEVGIKRRVLKVWMHNNKHSMAKKNKSNATHLTSDKMSDHSQS